jgi:hypothetical protein
MKRLCFVALLVVLVVFAGVNRPVQGYGSAGHVYIAQHAIFTVSANALYGTMAPDIIGYLPAPYAAMFEPNHVYFNLVPKAVTLPEKMFALGWMTHNERWGADFFAHVKDGGYAWFKGRQILDAAAGMGYDLRGLENADLLGHLAAEIAVDMLLAQRDPLLGMKVYTAAQLRSASIPNFLYQSGAIPIAQLALQGEAGFREFTKQYGAALAFSSPSNLDPMAEFVAAAASQQYGAPIDAAAAKAILALSISLCQPDYLPVVNAAIRQVQFRVWSGHF